MTHILTLEGAENYIIQHKDNRVLIAYQDDFDRYSLPSWQSIDEYCDDLLAIADAYVVIMNNLSAYNEIKGRNPNNNDLAEKEIAEFFSLTQKQVHGFRGDVLGNIMFFDYERVKADIEAKRTFYKNNRDIIYGCF